MDCQFLHHGKYKKRNDLLFLLNEMLRRKFITQEDYQKAIDMLDIELVGEEEIKEVKVEVLKRLLKSIMDYLVTHMIRKS